MNPHSFKLATLRAVHRERQRLLKKRIGHVNRIKGLLATRGIYEYRPIHQDRRQALAELTISMVSPATKAEA